ncbi:MAG TPA: hypothetical protein VF219_22605 [Vicinamibacterales bacterium]
MLQADAFGRGHTGHRRDLVENEVLGFGGADVQFSTPETHEVRKSGMRADGHAVLLRRTNRLTQDGGVAGMKSRGHVGRRDRTHQTGIVADRVRAEGFADVGVDVDAHVNVAAPPALPALQ